jgi:2-haloacid dehalogenase
MEVRLALTTLVFDAYGTLFDVAGAARQLAASEPAITGLWPQLAADWRAKQLEYTWLRAITGDYRDFAGVTADALDWAMERQAINPSLRQPLLDLYDVLPAFPEVPGVLATMAGKARMAILSNGTPAMLASAVGHAGLAGRFEALLSVDHLRTYKPADMVYDLIKAQLGAERDQVMFISSNGWDVAGATRYGFRTVWVNRSGLPVDRLGVQPGRIVADLTALPAIWEGG